MYAQFIVALVHLHMRLRFGAMSVHGILPERGGRPVPGVAIPLALVWQLTRAVGLDEQAVAGMTKEQTVLAINDYSLSQGDEPSN